MQLVLWPVASFISAIPLCNFVEDTKSLKVRKDVKNMRGHCKLHTERLLVIKVQLFVI